MGDVVIRPAARGDGQEMAELAREADEDVCGLECRTSVYLGRDVEHLEDAYENDPRNECLLVACDEPTGRVLGCVGFGTHPRHPTQAEVRHLFVAVGERRRGIGAKLLASAGRAARDMGYESLYAETFVGMHATERLLEREGWRQQLSWTGPLVHRDAHAVYVGDVPEPEAEQDPEPAPDPDSALVDTPAPKVPARRRVGPPGAAALVVVLLSCLVVVLAAAAGDWSDGPGPMTPGEYAARVEAEQEAWVEESRQRRERSAAERFGSWIPETTPDGVPLSESLPYVDMPEEAIDATWLGPHDVMDPVILDGGLLEGSVPYRWCAENGSGDVVFTAYVRNGRVIKVNKDNSHTTYWRNQGEQTTFDLPDLHASGEHVEVEPLEGNMPDPLDYTNGEQYADAAEEWFRRHGSEDPWNDALDYWDGNGP